MLINGTDSGFIPPQLGLHRDFDLVNSRRRVVASLHALGRPVAAA